MMFQNYCAQGYTPFAGEISCKATLGETPTSYVYLFEMPGLKADDIEVLIQGQYLVVCGKRTPSSVENHLEILSSERYFGPFQRTVIIPSEVNQEQIKAKLECGILEVELHKKGETTSPFKKIQVQGQNCHKNNTSKNN